MRRQMAGLDSRAARLGTRAMTRVQQRPTPSRLGMRGPWAASSSDACARFRLGCTLLPRNLGTDTGKRLRKNPASSVENVGGSGRAVAYLRTGSAANVGGDSGERQREAIRVYAQRA